MRLIHGVGIAAARHLQRRAQRIDLQRRQLFLGRKPHGAIERLLGIVELAFLQVHRRRQQMRFDQIVVLLERLLDQRPRLAFEALGEHARQTELGVHVIGEDAAALR